MGDNRFNNGKFTNEAAQTFHWRNQMKRQRTVSLTDLGWQPDEPLPSGRCTFRLDGVARIWHDGGPDKWAGRIKRNGKWEPFADTGDIEQITTKIKEEIE
jgi:hypothetical protein